MAISPKRIAAQAALRTLQLEGVDQPSLEAAYLAVLTNLDGAEVPKSALIDAVLAAEAELAEIHANDKASPYRQLFYGRSDDLETGEEVPTTDDAGVRFIGVFSGVNDTTDETPLTEGTIQEIQRYSRASDSRYTTEIRKYKFWGGRLHHTRPLAYIEGCVWSRTQALARFDADSTSLSPLPTADEIAWISRTVQFLVQENWLQNEGAYYGNLVRERIEALRGRDISGPSMPTNEATANPVSN